MDEALFEDIVASLGDDIVSSNPPTYTGVLPAHDCIDCFAQLRDGRFIAVQRVSLDELWYSTGLAVHVIEILDSNLTAGLRGSLSGGAVSWGFVSGVARGLVGVIRVGG